MIPCPRSRAFAAEQYWPLRAADACAGAVVRALGLAPAPARRPRRQLVCGLIGRKRVQAPQRATTTGREECVCHAPLGGKRARA